MKGLKASARMKAMADQLEPFSEVLADDLSEHVDEARRALAPGGGGPCGRGAVTGLPSPPPLTN